MWDYYFYFHSHDNRKYFLTYCFLKKNSFCRFNYLLVLYCNFFILRFNHFKSWRKRWLLNVVRLKHSLTPESSCSYKQNYKVFESKYLLMNTQIIACQRKYGTSIPYFMYNYKH